MKIEKINFGHFEHSIEDKVSLIKNKINEICDHINQQNKVQPLHLNQTEEKCCIYCGTSYTGISCPKECKGVTPQEVGDWEEEFDKEFRTGEKAWQPNYVEVKSFIHSILAKKKAEVLENIEELPIDLTASEMHKRVINIIKETL